MDANRPTPTFTDKADDAKPASSVAVPTSKNLPSLGRLLILPTTTADAVAICKLLGANEISCEVFRDIPLLCAAVSEDVGAILISEEFLTSDAGRLEFCLREQPVWSDLPIIVLSRGGAESVVLRDLIRRIGNVSVVERPVRVNTLISLVLSALRARDRQCQVRDHLAERESLLRSEQLAREEAERAGRVKDEFLATLSHELRTPLNAMLGWAQLLRDTPDLSEDLQEGLAVIDRNARAQTQIIEDLLDMSRIIAGKVRLEPQRVSLAEVIQAAVETVKPTAQARGVRLHVALDLEETWINGDAGRLQQIFWNLLTNAIKFTPRDGRVSVTLVRQNLQLEAIVQDSGEGIDPEFLPYVFDRFRQADATTTRRHGGLGLGLSIVKQLVEMHGGTITASTNGKGNGSTFRMFFPVMSDEPTASTPSVDLQSRAAEDVESNQLQPSTPRSGTNATDLSLRGVSVLVVDDETDARRLMRRLLEAYQATVLTADSVETAMSIFIAERPAVIVSDIGMPIADGYALIGRVRKLSEAQGGSTPAIALTAYARTEDRVRAIDAGFQSHLTKPVDPDRLLKLIAELATE